MTKSTQVIATAFSGLMLLGGLHLAAQQPSANRLIYVVTTDPNNRLVVGLEQKYFNVVENGSPRPVTYFNANSPVSVAVVGGGTPIPGVEPQDELIQAASVAEGVQKLAAAKNARKALVIVSAADTPQIPGDIQVLRSSDGNLLRAMVEVHNSDLLGFASSDPASAAEVKLTQPERLPVLTLRR